MKIIDRESFKALESRARYYAGRWSYIGPALALAKAILPLERPGRVVEVGPGWHPLFEPSTRIDIKPYPYFIRHDVGTAPWPVKEHDLVIALQVWEHLGPRSGERQREAFKAAMIAAPNIILSFPLDWKCPDDPVHHMITREVVAHWTMDLPPTAEILAEKHSRLICLWRF